MMFIDYVSLMLINMTAGIVLLAFYLFRGIEGEHQEKWAPPFSIVGFIALAGGLFMIWNWPLPGSYNSAFGETSIMLGALFIAASIALAKGWDLMPLSIYAFFGGLVSLVLGVRFIDLKLSSTPVLTGIGFLLTGFAGVFAAPILYLKQNRPIRTFAAIILLMTAAIWGLIGYGAYWMHMDTFSKWIPK